jgi:hypothetical protein
MPSVKKGESQSDYMKRCVPEVKSEGKPVKQCIAQCLSMYKQKWQQK